MDPRRAVAAVAVLAAVAGLTGYLVVTRSTDDAPGAAGDVRDATSPTIASNDPPEVVTTTTAPASGVGVHDDAATAAARRFLDAYVDDDGRVVRRDQGDDTVSEGQAYAILLAAAIGDDVTVDRVWGWSVANLQRPDGLLSWHWADGGVVDRESAPDAEIDAIRGLLLASDRSGDDRSQAAWRVADALADRVVVPSPGGDGAVVVPGEWALDRGVSNPSYFSPRALDLLVARSSSPWTDVLAGSRAQIAELTDGGRQLPPDWSTWEAGVATPVGGPSLDGAPRYAWDAARVPIRLAESCAVSDRSLAAAWYPMLRVQPAGIVRDLDGAVITGDSHPVALVAAAAAAHAAGDAASRDALLDAAEALDRDQPSYYGAAWVALGRVLLQTDLGGAC